MTEQQYILPDGSTTGRMDDAFNNAYYEIAEPIEQATGWRLVIFGEGDLEFWLCGEPLSEPKRRVTLPGPFALALAKALKREGGVV